MQFIPIGFGRPYSSSVRLTANLEMPRRLASRPAGAFQTPRCTSVRAKTPPTAAASATGPSCPSFS